MITKKTYIYHKHITNKQYGFFLFWIALTALVFTGCRTVAPANKARIPGIVAEQNHFLRYLDIEQCNAFLSPLALDGIRYVSVASGANLLMISGTPDQLRKAKLVLELVDSPESYCIENLGPASNSGVLPNYVKIQNALGNINIGTFNEPPANAAGPRAIIDIQGDSILAFFPTRYCNRIRELLALKKKEATIKETVRSEPKFDESLHEKIGATGSNTTSFETARRNIEPNIATLVQESDQEVQPRKSVPPKPATAETNPNLTSTEVALPDNSYTKEKSAENILKKAVNGSELPKTIKITFQPASDKSEDAETKLITDRAVPANGEDIIDMTLPETITLIQLLDLAGKYIGLNYVYDPREISNQSIVLKLHGNLQGELKVKHLYALLQTVLGDQGFAMIRQEKNLVVITKIDKALQTQPELVNTKTEAVQVGDTVVTRAFDIKHVDIQSIITLLQDMKLSVAATAFEKTNLLLVTCHADRMNRVEQLVEMIDRPGDPIECRFRRLDYTAAAPLVAKIRTLAQELEGIAVTATSGTRITPGQPVVAAAPKPPAKTKTGRPVYLDIDERTNRILMIGYKEELTVIEQLVDTLDIAQADPRYPHIYNIKNIHAEQAFEKLQKLEVLGTSGPGAAAASPASKENASNGSLTGESLVSILEATNQLLVRATSDQHERIGEFLDYIDVVPDSTRTLAYYEIKCIKAETAKNMLEELGLVGGRTTGTTFVAGPNEPSITRENRVPNDKTKDFATDGPQVVISESTNGLMIKATEEEHKQIADIIKFIDRKTPEEELSVQIYPVENSSPEHISDMLEQLLMETKADPEGKVEKIPKTPEQITVVPDPNTYSLIVHASQKNQQWIKDLITKLDKRRPQVLIDVTLVEVTRTDTFEYDLNLVANADDAVVGNIVIDSIQKIDSSKRIEGGFNLLDKDGNPTGQTKAFYSDEKVQALLTAIQRKNYGRVLAKPKVLVDDGQEGQIITTDETTYVKESIQIPQTGTPITTRDFVPIQASIQLQITPHISEGELLRLNVHLSRDDFGTRPLSGAPPDKATSEVTTTVFVPDNRTVILGGLVKLNQSKGGSKVPVLGDIPLVGSLFRSVDNSDVEKKLYVFLKANIVRPYEESRLADLQTISEKHQRAFEESESEFQGVEDFPGIRPKPMKPERVLNGYQ